MGSSGMAYLSDSIWFAAGQILTVIRDTVVPEYFSSGAKTYEALETRRNRATQQSRNALTDLFTSIAVCAFLVFLIILSVRFSRDDEEDEEEETMESLPPSVPLVDDLIDDPMSSFAYAAPAAVPDVKDDSNRRDCGDTISTPARMDIGPAVDHLSDGDNSFLNHTEPLVSNEIHVMPVRQTASMGPERHQESQCQHRSRSGRRTNRQRQQAKAREHKWFIRRTRSGQIYGKYPI